MALSYISSYDVNRLNEIDNSFDNITNINDTPYIKRALTDINISFVLSNITRLQSMLLCELGLSYVQQSQRYVKVTPSSFHVIGSTPSIINFIGHDLVQKSINLYNRMTELKRPIKGRPTVDDFMYGITYEDARSILPLCIDTNLCIATTADKLFDIFYLFDEYNVIFSELRNEMQEILPKNIYNIITLMTNYSPHPSTKSFHEGLLNHNLRGVNKYNPVLCTSCDDIIRSVAIGALTSQNSESPDVVYNKWTYPDSVIHANTLISNVLGYGHTAILEQARSVFAVHTTLSTYHQIIRHRLQNINRCSLETSLKYELEDYGIPKSIADSTFSYEYRELTHEYIKFYTEYKRIAAPHMLQFLLNVTPIRFTMSSNIRNDLWIFRERLCFTAQKDIRDIYLAKFRILFNICPEIIREGLPPCLIHGKCKEGKFTCNKFEEVKAVYSKYLE